MQTFSCYLFLPKCSAVLLAWFVLFRLSLSAFNGTVGCIPSSRLTSFLFNDKNNDDPKGNEKNVFEFYAIVITFSFWTFLVLKIIYYWQSLILNLVFMYEWTLFFNFDFSNCTSRQAQMNVMDSSWSCFFCWYWFL